MNLLETTLDDESSLVNFEAVQHAPPLAAAGDRLGLSGANITAADGHAAWGVPAGMGQEFQ